MNSLIERSQLYKSAKEQKLKVLQNNGTSIWIPLKDPKKSNPADVAKFPVAICIDKESTFLQLILHALKRWNTITLAITSRVCKASHECSIELSRTIEEAYEIDKMNRNIV